MLALGKADLEGMRCQHPGCTEEHGELVVRSRCHPGSGLEVVFDPEHGRLVMACQACKEFVVRVVVGDRPGEN